MEKLTKSQQKIYDFLLERSRADIPPTVREICEGTGFKSTSTVHAHLKTLERKGYITRRSGLTRAIVLTHDDDKQHGRYSSSRESETGASSGAAEKTVSVPIIGTVRAGMPLYAFEDRLGTVAVDESTAHGRELFALQVKGDSMINAGMLEGDIAVFAAQPVAENGEIVAALIDDEATVKRFYLESGHVRLQPENPDYEPIVSDSVQILGKVVMLIRRYG